MSKSAIKSLKTAESLIAVAGVVVSLVGYLDAMKRVSKDGKKAWRNADNLACLIINSVANAFQCENVNSLKENGFRDMAHAIESYVESNLDDWSGYQTPCGYQNKDAKIELDRLVDMVNPHIVYQQCEAKRIAQNAVIESPVLALLVEACHARAIEINAEIDQIVEYAGDKKPIQMDGDVNWIFDAAVIVWFKANQCRVDVCHTEALEMDKHVKIILKAARCAANSFGHVIGEWEDLCESLPVEYADKLSDLIDNLGGHSHREIRLNYVKALHKLANDL